MTIIKHDFQRTKEQTDKKSEKKKIPGYRLRIDLGFSSPPIWRSLTVPGTMTLAELHKVIQHCFGWEGDETYRFLVGKIFYSPHEPSTTGGSRSTDTQLHKLEEYMGFIFSYLFDGGCGWECELSLEEVIPDAKDVPQPVVADGEGASPPPSTEDIHEYIAFLQKLDNEPESRAQLLATHGLSLTFDASICDLEGINQSISQ